MRSIRYTAAALLLAFMVLPAQAQEATFERGAEVSTPVVNPLTANGGVTFTANESLDLVGGGVSCGVGSVGATTENFYLRAFVLSEYITDPITITSVQFGASYEILDEFLIAETQLSLHKLVGEPETFPTSFSFEDVPLQAAAPFDLEGANLELITVDFDGVDGSNTIYTPEDTLVVAWFVPNGFVDPDPEVEGDEFANWDIRFGQNGEGQEGPTYLATETSCGGIAPTDAAQLGDFADLHWVVVVNGQTAQVANESDVTLPRQVTLGQSYPNPFARSTNIPFSVDVASDVTIAVYDALGRQVQTLAAGTYTPGDYAIPFSGANLSAGLYTVRLQTGTDVQVRKMVLMD